MRTAIAIKVLRDLHEIETETGNLKEAEAIAEAISIMKHRKANEDTTVSLLKDRIRVLEDTIGMVWREGKQRPLRWSVPVEQAVRAAASSRMPKNTNLAQAAKKK